MHIIVSLLHVTQDVFGAAALAEIHILASSQNFVIIKEFFPKFLETKDSGICKLSREAGCSLFFEVNIMVFDVVLNFGLKLQSFGS